MLKDIPKYRVVSVTTSDYPNEWYYNAGWKRQRAKYSQFQRIRVRWPWRLADNIALYWLSLEEIESLWLEGHFAIMVVEAWREVEKHRQIQHNLLRQFRTGEVPVLLLTSRRCGRSASSVRAGCRSRMLTPRRGRVAQLARVMDGSCRVRSEVSWLITWRSLK